MPLKQGIKKTREGKPHNLSLRLIISTPWKLKLIESSVWQIWMNKRYGLKLLLTVLFSLSPIFLRDFRRRDNRLILFLTLLPKVSSYTSLRMENENASLEHYSNLI